MTKLSTVAFTVLFLLGGAAQAQAPRQPSPCPAATDTLSLLQRRDSAYPEAPKVEAFLEQHGFHVRCITRSTSSGTAGLTMVVGFQTDRGTITALVLPPGDDVQVSEQRTARGYRYTFTRARALPRRYVENVNGKVYYLRHGNWLFQVWDAQLATALRAIM